MEKDDALEQLKGIVAERTVPIVVWLGAGMSQWAGLPTWAKLKNELTTALRKKVAGLGEGKERASSKLKAAEAFNAEPWRAFQMLKEGLLDLDYEQKIRELINPGAVAQLPEAYSLLAQLNPRGVINLNIDRLATRALVADPMPSEFVGKDVGDYFHVFRNQKQFVCNLHGDVERVGSWVFTEPELTALMARESYKKFIETALTAHCNVFLGISPFDAAVGSHLERVAESCPSTGPHFWVTNFDTYELEKWAQKARVRRIQYPVVGNDHSEFVKLLREITSYRSLDSNAEPAAPVGVALTTNGALASPEELDRLPSEQIRRALNARAKDLLAAGDTGAYEKFFIFSQQYESPIHRAWHVTDRPPHNELLGFSLIKKAGAGAFGTVYQAMSPEGEEVAIKVLHQAISVDAAVVQTFRRGVRAMKFLSEGKLSRVSQFKASSEIPAMVVMDWIEGVTLKDVLASGDFGKDPFKRLEVALQLSEVIRQAHALPARVLHRDIRPTNIMLRDYWATRDVDVVVLDFDLSWHRDATELSIVQGATTTGYLAPEQMDTTRRIPTRSALVDSFGIAMTIFYLFSSRDPLPNESASATWSFILEGIARDWSVQDWRSFGKRVSRLIKEATDPVQSKRLDVSQISAELQRLKRALSSPTNCDDIELVAEELMARVFGCDYEVGDSSLERHSSSGTSVRITPHRKIGAIEVDLRWTDSGQHNHTQVKKWVGPALEAAKQMLNSAGFETQEGRADPQEIHAKVSMSMDQLKGRLDSAARALQRASEKVSFTG